MATITLMTSNEYRHRPSVTSTSLIGDYVREWREARQMRLADAAAAAGISKPYLSLIESGQRDPEPAVWVRIGEAIGCDLEVLKRKYRLEAARRASERWANSFHSL